MISVEEARRILLQHVPACRSAFLFPDQVHGQHLVNDVYGQHPFPLFDMSAVDGYAVCGDGPQWKVVGNVPAGATYDLSLSSGECVRIFTGAMVPEGTSAVIMQEYCGSDGDTAVHNGAPPAVGTNIRRKAESLRAGELLLRKGTRMGPASIGLLTSVGVQQVEVFAKPDVGVVRTGSEFMDEGALQAGRIFSSNEWMLAAALDAEGVFVESGLITVGDNSADLSDAIVAALEETDVLITTGGASVGDHDLVEPVLRALGAEIHFHGVAQKPGKPMLFATLMGKPVFALPGNPRAVMVLYWEYVLPFLHAMQGSPEPWLGGDRLPISHATTVKGNRAEFRAARVKGGQVTLLADEGSHMLRSLVDADALAYIPSAVRVLEAGDPIEVHYLPR
ncbi:MAG: molybdopterin molybdotransferase MoeA [Flavobacteriales bacterium]